MGTFILSLDSLEDEITNDSKLGNQSTIFETDIEKFREIIYPLLYDLHPIESSFVYLYVFKGKSQEEIARMFDVTQGAVSGRLRRASQRLQFLHSLPKIDRLALKFILQEFIQNPRWVQTMILMLETTSHAVVARLLGISQGGARQAFVASLALLEATHRSLQRGTPAEELYDPSSGLVALYEVLYNGGERVDKHEVSAWVRNQIEKMIIAYTRITQSYSILSKERCSVPDYSLIDLTRG